MEIAAPTARCGRRPKEGSVGGLARLFESNARLAAQFLEDESGRTKAGHRRLHQVQPDEGRQKIPVGRDVEAERQGDKDHKPGKHENGAIDSHFGILL